MDLFSECISLPIIVAIVYMIIEVYKEVVPKNNKKYKTIIPLIALALGITLAVIAYFFSPEILPADNILLAIFLGANSGLAATGANQVFKQMKKS